MMEQTFVDANSEKEQGNEFFNQKRFDEAIDSYSRSIALSPTAVAYANRAMAYLKVRRFQEAEADCTEALNLDDRYIKAYSRRATAKKELGDLKEALDDVQFAIRLDPANQEIKKQSAEIKSLLEKVSISELHEDVIFNLFAKLSLHDIAVSRCVCKSWNTRMTSPSFYPLLPSAQQTAYLALPPLRDEYLSSSLPTSQILETFDLSCSSRRGLDLSFLPYSHLYPITSSAGLLYVWCSSSDEHLLVACNPLTRTYRIILHHDDAPPSRSTLVEPSADIVLLLGSQSITMYADGSSTRLPLGLPVELRTPVLFGGYMYCLCEVGSRLHSGRYSVFRWTLPTSSAPSDMTDLHQSHWGNLITALDRPSLLRGPERSLFLVGRCRSHSLRASEPITIMRLDLDTLEWNEAARMPADMYTVFQSGDFEVFSSGAWILFLAERKRKVAMWECGSDREPTWRWIDGVSTCFFGTGCCFAYEASLTASPLLE